MPVGTEDLVHELPVGVRVRARAVPEGADQRAQVGKRGGQRRALQERAEISAHVVLLVAGGARLEGHEHPLVAFDDLVVRCHLFGGDGVAVRPPGQTRHLDAQAAELGGGHRSRRERDLAILEPLDQVVDLLVAGCLHRVVGRGDAVVPDVQRLLDPDHQRQPVDEGGVLDRSAH